MNDAFRFPIPSTESRDGERRLRILHVLNHTERLNGHVHAAIDLACAQTELGHQVAIASAGGSFDDLLAANSVETIHINQRRRPLTIAAAIIALDKLMRERRFDIVHAHMMTSAILCWFAGKATGTPLVTTVHNEFERSALVMGRGQRVIAVSGAVSRSMADRGVPKSRLRTVLNGTIGSRRNPRKPAPPAPLGEASILFVGGLHPRKGLPDLLEAFQWVIAEVPKASLHIVGEGPFRAVYEAAAAALPCAHAITFHGGLSDPRPWFRGADIFVLPSHAEPAGLVLSEACEGGCAIVATNVGGISEMLDGGRAGMLVPPKSPAKLAKALIGLLSDPAELEKAKRRASANVARMTIDRVARETLAVYSECFTNEASAR